MKVYTINYELPQMEILYKIQVTVIHQYLFY